MGGGLIHIIETLFKKQFWLVNMVIIFLIALFLALGLSHLLSARLAPYTVIRPQVSQESADPFNQDRGDQEMIISELLDQNVSSESEESRELECRQDQDCDEPMVCEDGLCVEPEEPEDDSQFAEGDCVSSDIAAAMIGTMASGNNVWSFGVVQDQTANRTLLVRAGDEVAGATVTRVTRNRVYVLNEGEEECLKAGEEPATSRPLASRNDRSSSTRRDTPSRSSSRMVKRESSSSPRTPP